MIASHNDQPTDFTVLVELDPAKGWNGLVEVGEDVVEVTRRFGSWTTVPDDETGRVRDILPTVAALLQTEVRKQERVTA